MAVADRVSYVVGDEEEGGVDEAAMGDDVHGDYDAEGDVSGEAHHLLHDEDDHLGGEDDAESRGEAEVVDASLDAWEHRGLGEVGACTLELWQSSQEDNLP